MSPGEQEAPSLKAMAWIIFLVIALVCYLLHALKLRSIDKNKKLPPGPRGLPILGHLHLLGDLPHRNLQKLAQKYGHIMYLRLGSVPTIVVSSPQAAELFLKTHDLNFASRPSLEAAKYISYGRKSIAFSEYGSYWRDMRKMCTLELLSNCKINSFKLMREEELGLLVKSFRDAARDQSVVDVSESISSLSANIICKMVFGKKFTGKEFDEKGFKAVIEETFQLVAAPNLGDYFPFLAAIDLQGLTKRLKAVSKIFDAFLERTIEEHIQQEDIQEDKTKDFVDVMLSFMGSEHSDYRLERTHIKALILDMLTAGVDTTATTVEWALSELIRHPRVMAKLQQELEQAVGMERKVEEADLGSLPYLDMVIKEIFRLHPPGALLLPHESRDDCQVDKFFIPKKSRIMVNVWAIGRDPNGWCDADKFWPERFLESSIDMRGQHFQLIPFGSGRRGCPGMQLGLSMVRLILAQIVHCFDWKLPNDMLPSELDMSEKCGLSTPRAQHLLAVPTYRLHD
uniref:Cytochrome P450 oxidase CYP736A220 n=1 Tax=Polygala tenuifolia TaxID=355332 RepID=A0A3G5ANJ0_9FABA|nr:cytochrome P450 oxidase CYP736A220 [Polygala tenuifolia]